jgi:hypothetical protein
MAEHALEPYDRQHVIWRRNEKYFGASLAVDARGVAIKGYKNSKALLKSLNEDN